MKLPNAEHAIVATEKLLDYLLSEIHPTGKGKAKFFRSFGYHENNTDRLKNDLIKIAVDEDAKLIKKSIFGKKFTIDGNIRTPMDSVIFVRTIWILETGKSIARFVTAYPLKKG